MVNDEHRGPLPLLQQVVDNPNPGELIAQDTADQLRHNQDQEEEYEEVNQYEARNGYFVREIQPSDPRGHPPLMVNDEDLGPPSIQVINNRNPDEVVAQARLGGLPFNEVEERHILSYVGAQIRIQARHMHMHIRMQPHMIVHEADVAAGPEPNHG